MKHGYYINTFLFLVFMLITVNQAKAECKSYFLRISFFFPLRIFAFVRTGKKKRMKHLQSMNGKARECKRSIKNLMRPL